MASRKLRVESVKIEECDIHQGRIVTILHIEFSRKLTALEVSGVKAVLEGEVK